MLSLALTLMSCGKSTGDIIATEPTRGATEQTDTEQGGPAGPGGPGGPGEDTDTDDTTAPRTGPDEAADPGAPSFPAVMDTLTVVLRTADAEYADTDGTTLDLCLTHDDCYSLDNPNVDDLELGAVDTRYIYGLKVAREAVDQVTLKLASGGGDRWEAGCLALFFDGELAYCEDELGFYFGTDGGEELSSWTDPEGLHIDCGTCWDSPLTHGPMVGAVTPETANLWGRTDGTRALTARLWEQGGEPVIAGWTYPDDGDDYTATMTLTGLLPDTDYTYQLEVDGVAQGAVGAFRTPPPDGAPGPLRVAFGSCSKGGDQPIFGPIRDAEPDAFFFVGDSHYANSDEQPRLRWYYRRARGLTERAAMLAHTPTLAVWDDHDYTGNNTDGTESGRDVALKIFQEYWANPAYGAADTPGVFFQWTWGDVDFFFLDDRYYRGLDGSLLGDAQTAWLVDAVTASEATFKVMITGSQWTEHGTGDSWAAYPDARAALFEALALNDVDGLVLMSGDVHVSQFLWNFRADSYDIPELTSSPLANPGSYCDNVEGLDELVACEQEGNFFVTVDFDTNPEAGGEPSLEAVLRDEAGVALQEWVITAAMLSP